MLIDWWTLKTNGSGLQGLSNMRGLLLGLEKTLIPPLAYWSFMMP